MSGKQNKITGRGSYRQPTPENINTNNDDSPLDDEEEDFNEDERDHSSRGSLGPPDGKELPINDRRSDSSQRNVKTSIYGELRKQALEVENSGHRYQSSTDNTEKKRRVRAEQKKQETGSNWLIIIVLSLFAMLVSFFVFDGKRFFPLLFENRQTNDTMDVINKWQTFQNEFESFERIYSEVIPIKGFKVLSASVRNVMTRNKWSQTSENNSPAIVLLIASEDNQNVLKCVERDFVNTLIKAYNEDNLIVINGRQTDATDIVDKFDKNFRDQQNHIIILENTESIPPKDVMSLHQFTDHENAKYKDVIIVLTAIHYQKLNFTKTVSSRDMDAIASQLFEVKWKNYLPGEQSFALISRLTPSVVTIIGQTEDNFKC